MTAILIVMTCSCLMAEALPPSSQKVLDLMEREISNARVKAARALQNDLKQAMKVGNLDLANAIQAEIDRQIPLILKPGETSAQGAMLARMAGKWVVSGDVWNFRADGTFDSYSDKNGKWEVKDGKVIIHWSRSSPLICTIISDELWIEDRNDKHWVLTK